MINTNLPYWNQLNWDQETINRFNSKIQFPYNEDGSVDCESCWEWIAGKNKDNYGSFFIFNTTQTSHRLMYQLFNGQINNDKLQVCHSCDNPSCVNPNHLWLGTHQDNVNDRQLKNRQANGIKNCFSKLTEKDIFNILEGIYLGKFTNTFDLSQIYNVEYNTILRILTGVTWKHITFDICKQLNCTLQFLKDKISNVENYHTYKLTTDQVNQIYSDLCLNHTLKYISKKFNVSISTISNIKNGISWGHVTNNKSLGRQGVAKGEDSKLSKLTESNVITIREHLKNKTRTIKSLSVEFNISITQIRRIKLRESWKHI